MKSFGKIILKYLNIPYLCSADYYEYKGTFCIMVNTLPKLDPNGIYSAKQTRNILGIGKTALYQYDNDGFLKHEIRPESGRRVWRGKSIINFFQGQAH